ncbi:hypothetical protein GH714_026051 [Hevea brasiliensis]|uniref:Uncharacterized protein n=1 Tax=Hevea brasiliensis TaxID=3981 RepID=A0A6A6NJC4_HEVBR|nr:hypothetical protein GH714_026051 [Hevea brasiliensis]
MASSSSQDRAIDDMYSELHLEETQGGFVFDDELPPQEDEVVTLTFCIGGWLKACLRRIWDFLASGRSGGDDAPIPMDSDSPTLSGFVPILKDGNPESLVVSKTGMVQASVHGKELQNSTDDAAGVIVGEPKRRCTKNMELNPAVEEDDGIGSKNLIEAGSDSQARLAQ